MLGELEGDGRFVIGDLEAGVGTLLRMHPGQADLVLVVAQPTAKAIEVARRALEIADSRAKAILIANRVRDASDLELIRSGTRWTGEVVVVPEDPAVARADEDGLAPIDSAPDAAAVLALQELARRLQAA